MARFHARPSPCGKAIFLPIQVMPFPVYKRLQYTWLTGTPYVARWEEDRLVPKAFWRRAGEIGMLCPTVPEAFGGSGSPAQAPAPASSTTAAA